MKKLSKTLLALLLIVSMVLVPIESKAEKAGIGVSTEEKDLTEEKAKSIAEELKKNSKLVDKKFEEIDPDQEVRVMVEVDGLPLITLANNEGKRVSDLVSKELKSQEEKTLRSQNLVKNQMSSLGVNFKELSTYTAVINAFAVKVKYSDIKKIESIKGVKEVAISNEYTRPEPNMLTSNDQVYSKEAWDLGYKGEGRVLAVIDTGVDPSHKDFVMTDGVSVRYTEDQMNRLVKDDNLPGKYYSAKVPYAYNYYDMNDVVHDTGASQHGMHVGGTMAANGDPKNGGIKGVAPDAQLISMKVFSNDIKYATTFSDIYVKAIDDAIKLGADSVNLSLGSPAGFHRDNGIEQRVLENARRNGVLATISAGNERNIVNGAGKALIDNPDTGVLGSPSSNRAAFSIASLENTHTVNTALTINHIPDSLDEKTKNDLNLIPLNEAGGSPTVRTLSGKELEYVFVGTGTKDDFEKTDVKGKVAIAIRGNTFTDTIANGMEKGALAVLVYNHESGGEAFVNMAGGEGATIPFAFMRYSSGTALKKALEADETVRIVFSKDVATVENPEANKMSTFSSWGTTPDLQLKPELTTPGGNIYSTQNNNQYATMSGTSMAAPHAAGGVGIVREFIDEKIEEKVFDDMDMKERSDFARLLLMNTADIKADPEDEDKLFSPRQQGAGLMNLKKATTNYLTVQDNDKNSTSYMAGKLELGDKLEDMKSVHLKLHNYGKEDVTLTPVVKLIQEDAMTNEDFDELVEQLKAYLQGYTEEQIIQLAISNFGGPNTLLEEFSTIYEVTLDPITVAKRGEKLLDIDLDLSSVDKNRFVEGFIDFVEEDESAISLPFLGFKGRWDSLRVIDTMDASNLLADPSKADEKVWLVDKKQDSQFMSSGFYQSGLVGGTIANPNKVLIAPLNTTYNLLIGVGSAYPIVSQLRNAKFMEYQVLDGDGNLLRNLYSESDIAKIYKLDAGNNPFRGVSGAKFNGMIDGKYADEGSYIYRIKSTIDYKDAIPQTDDFHFVVDNTAPVFEKDDEGNIKYSLDTEKNVIKFRGHDVFKDGLTSDDIALLSSVSIYNVTTRDSKVISMDMDEVKAIDKENDLYEFTIDLTPYLGVGEKEELEINLVDNVYNTSSETIVINGSDSPKDEELVILDKTIPNVLLDSPDLLNMYGNGSGNGGETTKVSVSGSIWGWDKLDKVTFGDTEIPFESSDLHVADGDIKYEGPGYIFNGEVELTEGYKEIPLNLHADGKKDFGIGRRFFVDLTKPQVDGQEVYRTDKDQLDINFHVKENLFMVEILRGSEYITEIDNSSDYGFNADVDEDINDRVEGLKDGINKVTYSISDYLYTTDFIVYILKNTDVNIDGLLAMLKKAEAIDQDLYITSKVRALNKAIDDALDLLDNPNASQEDIDEAIKAIDDAIKDLKLRATEEERKPLRDLLDQAKEKKEEEYTEDTFKTLKDAIEEVEYILDDKNSTSEDISRGLKLLQDAIDNLVKVSSPEEKEDLKDLLDQAKEKKEEEYTEETYKVLKDTIDEVEEVLNDPNATSEDVKNAKDKLQKALDGLKEKPPVKPEIIGQDKTIYVGDDIDVMSLFEANDGNGNPIDFVVEGSVKNMEVGEYKLTAKASNKGIEVTKEITVKVIENDKTALNKAIEEALKIDFTDKKFTEESLNEFIEALEKAKEVLENVNALKDEIKDASDNLNEKRKNLKLAMDLIEDLIPRLSGHDTSVGVGSDFDVKDMFKATDKDGSLLDIEISGEYDLNTVGEYTIKASVTNNGASASKEAMLKVVENDKTALRDVISMADTFGLTRYTKDSVKAFKDALAKANEVLNNINASKDDIRDAVKDLVDKSRELEIAKEGWIEEDGSWYYYKENEKIVDKWIWAPINDPKSNDRYNYKYFDKEGVNIDQFYHENGKVWLSQAGPDKTYLKGWWRDPANGQVYYFRETSGSRVEGFQYIDKAWYYFRDKSNTLANGWQYIDGVWYYMDPDTNVRVSDEWKWMVLDNGEMAWKYFDKDGHNIDQFYKENGKVWLSLKGPKDGYQKGWWKDPANGQVYYFRETSGSRVEGFQFIEGAWYYFRKDSATMAKARQFIDGKWYEFNQESGVLEDPSRP